MKIIRPLMLLLVVAMLCSTTFTHAEWLPGDWVVSEGIKGSSIFSIGTPDNTDYMYLDSNFGNRHTPDKQWEPQKDFQIVKDDAGFSVSSSYQRSRFGLNMKGRVDEKQGDGIYYSLCFVPDDLLDSLVLSFVFAQDYFNGRTFSVDGQTNMALTLPANFSCSKLVLAEGNKGQVCIHAPSKYNWTLSKTDEGKVKLAVDICSGMFVGSGIPLFFTARISARDMTTAPYCSIFHPMSEDKITRYSPFQFAFQTLGVKIGNPYDLSSTNISGLVADESGNRERITPIYYMPSKEVEIDEKLAVVPAGRPFFIARYTPRNTGNYFYRLYLGEGELQTATPIMKFTCQHDGKGFVIVSPSDNHKFQLSSGEGFFPIGYNLGWLNSQLPSEYDNRLRKMAAAGINCTRVWISTWGINVFDNRAPLGMSQLSLYRLDKLFESANKYGVKVILVLTNHEDLNKNMDKLSLFNRRDKEKKTEDFFTDDTLKQHFMEKVAYIANRYSPYSSLMAFETGNELDYSTDMKTLTPWNKEVMQVIRNNDPNRHLVTSSLGFNRFDSDFWTKTTADFAQFHIYFNNLAYLSSDAEKSAESIIASFHNQAKHLNMPYFCAEFGYSESDDSQSLNEIDKKGYLLMNSLWSSFFGEMSGSAMNWWWDTYIMPNKLHSCYQNFAKYLSNVDTIKEQFTTEKSRAGDCNLTLMRGNSMLLGRLEASDNNWVDLVASLKNPETKEGRLISIKDLPRAFIRIQWWNTETGDIINEYTMIVSERELLLTVPEFKRDIALKILFERCDK